MPENAKIPIDILMRKAGYMVVYFTGTGNSRYAAEALAIRLGDELVNANKFIKSCKVAHLSSETPYIFVAPTYAWRIPRIFSDFIEKSELRGSTSAYFVMTCGTDIGSAGIFLKKLCEKKSFVFKGVLPVVMPENYVAMFDVTEKAEAERMIAEADNRLRTISELISGGKDFPAEKADLLAGFKSRAINPIFYRFIEAKGFRVTDKCISCGRCEEICPLNNVSLTNGKPVYGNSCTHCMACICGCPTEAIEYKRRTAGKPRYFNEKSPVIDDVI